MTSKPSTPAPRVLLPRALRPASSARPRTRSVLDLSDLKLVQTITVGDYPEGIEAASDGSAVYVACWSDNELVRIDVETLSVSGRATVGDGPRAFGAFLR